MPQIIQIILTLICAFIVGKIMDRLHVPGGMMIGAVIGACVLSVTTGQANMPETGKTIAQIIAGGFIGSGIKREDLSEMKKIAKPALILLPCFLMLNIVSGFLVYSTGKMDLVTAMMCCVPGGMSDVPIIAADMGADPAIVVVLQFIRLVVGIGVFPLMIRAVTGSGAEGEKAVRVKKKKKFETKYVLLTLLVAAICGIIGNVTPIPAGTMAFATLGSIVFACSYPKAQMPRLLRKCAQLLSGAYVGASIGMEQVRQLGTLALPVIIVSVMYTLACFGIGFLMMRAKCFTRAEGMLAATPAGASDMALISADLGIENPKLIVLQVLRLIVVVLFFPSILSVVISLYTGLIGGGL